MSVSHFSGSFGGGASDEDWNRIFGDKTECWVCKKKNGISVAGKYCSEECKAISDERKNNARNIAA